MVKLLLCITHQSAFSKGHRLLCWINPILPLRPGSSEVPCWMVVADRVPNHLPFHPNHQLSEPGRSQSPPAPMYPQDCSPQQLSLPTEASYIYQGHPFRFSSLSPAPTIMISLCWWSDYPYAWQQPQPAAVTSEVKWITACSEVLVFRLKSWNSL